MQSPRIATPVDCAQDDIARLVEEITQRLQAGEPVNLEEYVVKHPEFSEKLRRMFPTIAALAEIGLADAALASGECAALGATESNGGASERAQDATPLGTLGDFRLLREIGRGGMGVVYEAEQISLRRKVALKVLPFAGMLDARQIARFENEARAAATVHHTNVVPIYFVGNDRKVHYYAMQLIDGQSLADAMQGIRNEESGLRNEEEDAAPRNSVIRSPQSALDTSPIAALSTARPHSPREYFRTVAEIGAQVAEALDHAHNHGVIHRDVKPANILIDDGGKPWITDFGLARIGAEAGITMSGDLLGTLRYMSPEQALAKRVVIDHRTDIYSLSATFFELLTLEPVFSGMDRQNLIHKIAFEEPRRPSSLNRAIPSELDTIVLKGLEKNPDDRYDSAQQLADDLRRFLDNKPIQARPPSLLQRSAKWSRRHRPAVAAAAAVLLLATVGLATSTILLTRERAATTEALASASANLQAANDERTRAEATLRLAMQAVEEAYLKSIGEERLLRESTDTARMASDDAIGESAIGPAPVAQKPILSENERELINRGLAFYDQIASQNPSSPEALFESGKAFARIALLQAGLDESEAAQEAYEQATTRLEQLTEQYPARSEYFVELGKAYYGQGQLSRWWPQANDTFDKAVVSLTEAIALNPQSVEAFELRAKAHEAQGDVKSALIDFDAAVRLEPANAVVHYNLGRLLKNYSLDSQRPDPERALHHAKEAVRLAAENVTYRQRLADMLLNRNNVGAAKATWKEALDSTTAPHEEFEIRSRIAALDGITNRRSSTSIAVSSWAEKRRSCTAEGPPRIANSMIRKARWWTCRKLRNSRSPILTFSA